MTAWAALLAAFGLGSVVAAIIARGVAIAQLRQAWINSLRDDLAAIFSSSDRTSLLVQDGADDEARKKQTEESHVSMAAYRKVLMRLNPVEPLHAELADKLEALNHVGARKEYLKKIDTAVAAAQRVLKVEWEVTKYGPFVFLLSKDEAFWRGRRARERRQARRPGTLSHSTKPALTQHSVATEDQPAL